MLKAEVLKAFGLNGTGFENLSLMDTFGSPGHSALGTASLRDVEQMRGWNFTAILAKALQFGLANMAVYCPKWIAEAVADANGEEYKAAKRVNGTEQYGVPEDWVAAPREHRIAKLFREPNKFLDEATLLFQIAEQTEVHGVAHVLVLPDRSGLPKELWVIPKSAIRPMAPSAKFPEGSYRIGHLSKLSINMYADDDPQSIHQALARISNREYSAKNVISVGLPSPVFLDDFLNPSSAISDVIDTDRQIHVSRRNMLEQILSNGPRMEPLPGVTIANDEWNKLIDEFVANNTGPSRNGQPWRAPAGVKVVNDGQTGRELELAKSADQSRDHTLGQRGMSSSMIGLGEGGSYAQVVGLIKGNQRLLLQPLMRIYGGQLTLGLKRFFEAPQDQFMTILQAASIDDPEQRRAEIDILMRAKAVKRGEVRDFFNLMPFGDDNDEKIAGEDEQAASPFGMGADPYADEYSTDDSSGSTDSGSPESPGIGMPEADNRPELTTSGMVKTTETDSPKIGSLSRREFLRHQKNIFDILKQVSAGQIKPKAAVLLLTTLGVSRQEAQEYIDTVNESNEATQANDTPRIVTAATATEATGVDSMGSETTSALFSRMLTIKGGFGKSLIDDQARTAATNPDNGLRMPSLAEQKAGTYRKGKVRLCGLQIEIENPQGSVRSGKRPDGSRWAVEMADHYGYLVGAVGYDKDQLDVFVAGGTEPEWTGDIYVVNQCNADGSFDEHKCMIGYANKAEAIVRYLDNYADNWSDRILSVTALSLPEFKAWVFDPNGGPIVGELTPAEAMRYKVVSQQPMIAGEASEETIEEMEESDSEDFYTEELVKADPMRLDLASGFFRAADTQPQVEETPEPEQPAEQATEQPPTDPPSEPVEETDDEDDQQRAELIAEILTGIYGDEASRLIADGEDFAKMASLFEAFTAKSLMVKAQPGKDPRDADGDGRIFDGTPQEQPAGVKPTAQPRGRVRNTPEQVAAIHADIDNALKGERNPKSAKALADKLSNLTVTQLHELKKKFGISASGKVKKELVDKIAKRLDMGRRAAMAPKQPQLQTPQVAKKPESKPKVNRIQQKEAEIEKQVLQHLQSNPNQTMRDLATLTQVEPGPGQNPLESSLNRVLKRMVEEGKIVAKDRQFGGPLFSAAQQAQQKQESKKKTPLQELTAKKPASVSDDVDTLIKSGDRKAMIAKLHSIGSIAEDALKKLDGNKSPEVIRDVNRSLATLRQQSAKLRETISPDGEQLRREALQDIASTDTDVLKIARDKLREASRRFYMAGDSLSSDDINQKANAINARIVQTAIDSAQQRQAAQPKRNGTIQAAMKVFDTVSEEFKAEISNAINAMPKEVKAIIADTNIKIHLGSKLTAILPDLEGEHPRGWPEGYTWKNAEACARMNIANVAETYVSQNDGTVKKNRRAKGALYHEVGHTIDHEVGIKNDENFKKAYEKDTASFTIYDRHEFEYMLQEGSAGRSETVAEGIAILCGTGSGGFDENFKKKFPRSMKILTKILKQRARTTGGVA